MNRLSGGFSITTETSNLGTSGSRILLSAGLAENEGGFETEFGKAGELHEEPIGRLPYTFYPTRWQLMSPEEKKHYNNFYRHKIGDDFVGRTRKTGALMAIEFTA